MKKFLLPITLRYVAAGRECIEAKKNPHGVEAKKIHEPNYVQATHTLIKSGLKLIKHITIVDVFFYVLEGIGTVESCKNTESVFISEHGYYRKDPQNQMNII